MKDLKALAQAAGFWNLFLPSLHDDEPGKRLSIMQHHAPEGHCEVVFADVRLPLSSLLGQEGAGFAMAQARLGPGRIHHCMRTIGVVNRAMQVFGAMGLSLNGQPGTPGRSIFTARRTQICNAFP